MEGRHVHPSTLYPGGVGTTPTVQLFTDYLTRLMRYVEFMKRVVPMHDDLFDFFYEALPGYEEVGRRRARLGLLGQPQRPRALRLQVRPHDRLGPEDVRHPRRHRGRQAGHQRPGRDQPRHPDPARQLVLRGLGGPGDVRRPATRWATRSTAGTRGTSTRSPGRRSATSTTSTAGSCRRAGSTARTTWPRDTGGGPIARLWATALGGLVDFGYVKSTGHSVLINLPRTVTKPEVTFEWKIPTDKNGAPLSNAIERDRARTYFQAYAAACALYFMEKALAELRAGHTKTWEPFRVPGRGDQLRVHRGRARRAVAPHGDQGRQDRELPPVPADAVERQRP